MMYHILRRHVFSLAMLLFFSVIHAGFLQAQEGKSEKAANSAKANSSAIKDNDAKAKDATPAAPEAGSVSIAYQTVLKKWKSLLKDLRELRIRFITADEKEAILIQKKWDELIEQGHMMAPLLRKTAIAAYQEAPNVDRDLTRLLAQFLKEDFEKDLHGDAAALGKIMVENDSESGEIYAVAGTAAFFIGNYENAKNYLKKAEQANALDDQGKGYLLEIDAYKEYWEKEKKLREAEAKANDLPRVKLTTNKGEILIELFENEAPQTVGNFISLVEKGFYDGLIFHRVLKNFMAQGGCPKGTGEGGPGYDIYCETDHENRRMHFPGTLSMAHSGKDTGGSQFFLTFVPTPHLNSEHTVFGRVIEGLKVLPLIQRRDPLEKDAEKGDIPQADKIIKAEVIRKRDHPYVPTKVQ